MNEASPQKQPTKVIPVSPTVKQPIAINMATHTGDIEDDREVIKPQEKPIVKNQQPTVTASPQTQNKQEASPERRQPEGNISPKKPDERMQVKPVQPGPQTGQSSNLSKSTVIGHHQEEGDVYNPYNDLNTGKSEDEVLGKLRQENTKLRKELKSISDDLTNLLERKNMEKKESGAPRVGDIISGATVSEKGLQSELELAQKKLAQYQKEVAAAKEKFQVHATYERFQGLQDHLYETENKIQDMTSVKRNMEKALREKEKLLDSVVSQSTTNTDVIALDERARYYREKVREGDRKKEQFDKLTQKRKEFVQDLQQELDEMKKEYKKVQEKTGYEHKEVPKPEPTKKNTGPEEIKKKVPISKHIEEELACTLENFEKLKKEIKIIERAEELREKKGEREFVDMSEQVEEYERNRNEAISKIAERKKEIELLQTKLKDLSRIVRHQALAPLQREEELALKEASEAQIKAEAAPVRRHVKQPSKKESILPKKPQPYHLLVEYAKHNFNSKGFRKDERGKTLREDEGTNFNDKDIVGKQRVKIIAMDVWHDDNCINGLQGVYETETGDMIEGGAQVKNADKSKLVTFETLEEDYVKEITGFINKSETVIECLIMRTFRGETMKVGTASKDSKLFKFDINELEYPSMFYGSLREDKNGPSKLARLGVLIATQSVEEKLHENDKKVRHNENKKAEAEQPAEKEEGEDRGEELVEEVSPTGGESRRSQGRKEVN